MTIDEAIKHCKKNAEAKRNEYEVAVALNIPSEGCLKRAEEQEQLVEWLKELKNCRDTMEMIKRHYIFVEKGVQDNPNDLMIGRVPTVEPQNNWGRWVISEIRCPNCLEYFDTDCYSTGELNKCPSCGAKMKEGAE